MSRFTCLEQRLQDVTKAVATLQPIVSLIKLQKKMVNESTEMQRQISSSAEDVKVINGAIESVCGKSIKTDLEVIFKKYNSRVEDAKKVLENHDLERAEVEEEIIEYLLYTTSFLYVGYSPIAEALLEKATSEDASEEEFFATLLLLTNDNVDDPEGVSAAAIEIAANLSDPYKKHILMNIGDWDQEKVCNLIRESK